MDKAHKLSKPQLLGLLLLLTFFNYRRFMRAGAADALIRELEGQTRAETRREEARLLWYVFASIAAPLVLGVIASAFHLR